MALEPHPPPQAALQTPEYPLGVQLLFVALLLGGLVGLTFFPLAPRTELVVGLALFLVEQVLIIVATAVAWPGQLNRYPLLAFGLVWLWWNFGSGLFLAMSVWDIFPRNLLSGVLEIVLALAPIVVSFVILLLADTVRRWVVSRHTAS
jgi:hypothetical protein